MKIKTRVAAGLVLVMLLTVAMVSVAAAASKNVGSTDAAMADKVSKQVLSSIKNGQSTSIQDMGCVNGVPAKKGSSFNAKTVENALLAELISKKLGVDISCFLLDGEELYFNGVKLNENDKYKYSGKSFKLADFDKALNKKTKSISSIDVCVADGKHNVSLSSVIGNGGFAALADKYVNNKGAGAPAPVDSPVI